MEEYKDFTDAEIIRALELMVSKEDLKMRAVAEAILNSLGYSEIEIIEQLAGNEYLNGSEPIGIIA